MAVWIVCRKSASEDSSVISKDDDVITVKDGFSFLCFLVPSVWFASQGQIKFSFFVLFLHIMLSTVINITSGSFSMFLSCFYLFSMFFMAFEHPLIFIHLLKKQGYKEEGLFVSVDKYDALMKWCEGLNENSESIRV